MTKDDTELYNKWRNDLEVMYSTNPFLDVYHLEETGSTSSLWTPSA